MNWSRIEGNWKQLIGNIHLQWGKLIDDQLEETLGRNTKISGRIQEIIGASIYKKNVPSGWRSNRKNIDFNNTGTTESLKINQH